MKSVISLLITAVLIGPVTSSCSKWINPIDREDIVLTKVQQEILENGNVFAIDLFREMCKEVKGDNIFISPLSASLAISAVTNGASGSTLDQTKATLGFESFSMEEMNKFYKHLVPALKKVDNTVKLLVANAVWIEQTFPVKAPFINALQEYYNASVNKLDFNDPAAPNVINKWCADNTNNLIKKVIDQIDRDCRLMYTNAIYFKGKWKTIFDKKNSWQGSFTSRSGAQRSVTYMEQTHSFRYMSEKGVSIAEIPYGNEAFSMIIVLPDAGIDVMDVVASLSWEKWTEWMNGFFPAELNLRIPRFKVEFDSEELMIPILSRMGMDIAFDPFRADFSRISDIPLYIALLKQNAYIQVDEEGTEAAAVTIIGCNTTSVGPGNTINFHVDRPFLYFIREKSTGTILFSGLITDL